MAQGKNTDAWVAIHQALKNERLSVDQLCSKFGYSRVTVSRVLKASPVIEVDMGTWPRLYSVGHHVAPVRVEVPKSEPTEKEKEQIASYLDQLLKAPIGSLDIISQFQAVESVEGAKHLHKALADITKVAAYYVTLLEE